MDKLTELKELYLLSFTEDTKEDADFLFEKVFSKAKLISKELGGKTVSMLYLMDCTLKLKNKELPFYYLYAACTHPNYRGKGLMGELLKSAKDFAKKEGRSGIILKPAKPSLFKFYENYGFHPYFKVAKAGITPLELKPFPTAELYEVPLCEYNKIRQTVLPQLSDAYVCFKDELFCSAASECVVVTDKNGSFVVFEKRDDTLLCKECIISGENPNGILCIVKALFEKTGTKKAELRFPQSAALDELNFIKNEYFSVISEAVPNVQNPYHGFAFD